MTRRRLLRPRTAGGVVLALSLVVTLPAAAAGSRRPPGPNLVTNSGFEDSALEGTPAAPPGSLEHPLLPTGWVFEGATVLFDHSPVTFRSGKRGAAISGSLSTNRQVCATGSCQPNPVNPLRDVVYPYYSLAPAWRTQAPVSVTAGTQYLMTAYVAWIVQTIGEGARMSIRWLDAGGLPIALAPVAVKAARDVDSAELLWTRVAGTAVAPPGAVSAHLLFGATDDNWTGQVRYDDVYFGTAPTKK